MEMCYEGTLAMPSNYVVMDSEEMSYAEGGAVLTYTDSRNILAAIAINPTTIVAIGVSIVVAKRIVSRVAAVMGGVVGWAAAVILGVAVSFVAAQLITFARGIGLSAVKKRSVDFSFGFDLSNNKFGLDYCLK